MGIERKAFDRTGGVAGGSPWETDWSNRGLRDTGYKNESSDMPAETEEERKKIRLAYEQLPAYVQEYVDVTERLRAKGINKEDRLLLEKEQQSHLSTIISDEKYAIELIMYTDIITAIRFSR